ADENVGAVARGLTAKIMVGLGGVPEETVRRLASDAEGRHVRAHGNDGCMQRAPAERRMSGQEQMPSADDALAGNGSTGVAALEVGHPRLLIDRAPVTDER